MSLAGCVTLPHAEQGLNPSPHGFRILVSRNPLGTARNRTVSRCMRGVPFCGELF